jgi:ATP-dependent DNA ligase
MEIALESYIREGYEGVMFRSLNGLYAPGKRSRDLLKYKRWYDNEFLIVSIIDSRDNPGQAVFVCKNDLNSETFKVVPEGSREQKAAYFDNRVQYIGKKLTVRYFDRTPKPKEVPFHAVGMVIRDYE